MSAEAYAALQRSLVDSDFITNFRSDPEKTLRDIGVDNPNELIGIQQMIALMTIGVTQQTTMAKKLEHEQDQTLGIAGDMKTGLKRTLEQIDQAFTSTKRMYEISFFLGAALIIAAVIMTVFSRDPLLPTIFGALGTADVLTFFLAKPQEKLQSSRANLAQLQAALYNWFMDSVNQNSKQSILLQAGKIDEASVVSETLMNHTDRTLEMLQKYCKLVEG